MLKFLFDYLSPYAYLAWTQIPALAARHGLAVEPVPVLLAGLLNEHGQKGPAEIPAKRVYVFKEVLRRAHRLGVPLAPPPSHPFNPLLALRVSSIPMSPEHRVRLISELFKEAWGGGAGVTDEAVVAHAASAAGEDGPALIAQAKEPEAKLRVRHQTERAVADGAFGVPTVLVDGELFWGLDSLPDVELFLHGGDPVDPELVQRWEDLPASAHRTPRSPETAR